VLGFVDNNKKKIRHDLGFSYLTILRVYHYLRSLGGEVLIIADKRIDQEDLLTVADDCLKLILNVFSSFYYRLCE
jgi:hypothetical protein